MAEMIFLKTGRRRLAELLVKEIDGAVVCLRLTCAHVTGGFCALFGVGK